MKIPLVDDDPVVRRVHTRLQGQQGHEVLEATDGELAWQLIQQTEISFVVSDWMMPNLAGVDLCRRIRAADFDRYIYVILCTSRGAKADLIEGMDAGADDFLVKPTSPAELRVKVRAGERVISLQQGLAQKNRELAGINKRLEAAHKLMEDDLKAAALMQERLLPLPTLQAQQVKCMWSLQPSAYVAGDIFNFFTMDENQVGFYLLDASGHGVPAAMLSVTLSMMLTPDATHGSPLKSYRSDIGAFETLSPDEAVRELNRRFQSRDDRYFTMVYCLLDVRTGMLRIAQAGHPPPILIRAAGELQVLGTGGMPVGLWEDIQFDSLEISMTQGDRILLYSDGVTECMNEQGEAFGDERLLAYLTVSGRHPLNELLAGLSSEVRVWRGAPELGDDLSVLAVELQ